MKKAVIIKFPTGQRGHCPWMQSVVLADPHGRIIYSLSVEAIASSLFPVVYCGVL